MRLPTKANDESCFDMKTKKHDPKTVVNNLDNLLELTCTSQNSVDNKWINKLKFPLRSGLGVTKGGSGSSRNVHTMLEDALRISSDAAIGDLDYINHDRSNRFVPIAPLSKCRSQRVECSSDTLIRNASEDLEPQQEKVDPEINHGRLNRIVNIAPLSKCQARVDHQAKRTTSTSQELISNTFKRVAPEEQRENALPDINHGRKHRFVDIAPLLNCQPRVDYQAKKTTPPSQDQLQQIRTKEEKVSLINTKNMLTITQLIDIETKRGCMIRAILIWLILLGVASIAFGSFNNLKENTFNVLRDMNNLTDLETFAMIFGQQLCALFAFTALEIREDMILPPEENMRRGIGTEWPRSRVFTTIYIEFPIYWAFAFVLFCCARAPLKIFSNYEQETWAVWAVKMIVWFIVWEFIMYFAHRAFHSHPWLYKIAHKGHHVVMDFALGPHAPPLEKLTHYVATIIASQIVGVSVGSWIFALNILMTQCVLEHSYSSLTIPLWNTILVFNTADMHQLHHVHNNFNFGYAFNIFDPIFGTLLDKPLLRSPPQVTGPATSARLRMLMRGCFKRNLFETTFLKTKDCHQTRTTIIERENEKNNIFSSR